MKVIRYVDAPPKKMSVKPKRSEWDTLRANLIKRGGWAQIAASRTHKIATNKAQAARAHGFDVATRKYDTASGVRHGVWVSVK